MLPGLRYTARVHRRLHNVQGLPENHTHNTCFFRNKNLCYYRIKKFKKNMNKCDSNVKCHVSLRSNVECHVVQHSNFIVECHVSRHLNSNVKCRLIQYLNVESRVSLQSNIECCITKTCLYNFDPLKPHFYIVKLGSTGVYIIFLFFSLENIDCRYSLEPPHLGGSTEYPQSMF